MQPDAELIYRLQGIVILLGAAVCAVVAFCVVFSKPHPSKLDRIYKAVLAAVCTFVIVGFVLWLLCYAIIGSWCEGCQEFH